LAGDGFGEGEPVVPWDYLATAIMTSAVSLDVVEFLRSTGLTGITGVVAHMQVDCPATGSRHSARSLLAPDGKASIKIPIGPNQVAQRIEVSQSVLLDLQDSNEPVDLAAFRRGSRLWQSDRPFRFILEGSASNFPTEAFDFGAAGLPSTAAWKLQFEPDSLDDPYMGAVRLLLNATHPQAPELLSGKASLVQSMLFHTVVEQLFMTVADRFEGDVPTDFVPDSVGDAINNLTSTYLGKPLADAVRMLREDRSETLCKLQAGTSFLFGGSR
jgi:hypothetical protein